MRPRLVEQIGDGRQEVVTGRQRHGLVQIEARDLRLPSEAKEPDVQGRARWLVAMDASRVCPEGQTPAVLASGHVRAHDAEFGVSRVLHQRCRLKGGQRCSGIASLQVPLPLDQQGLALGRTPLTLGRVARQQAAARLFAEGRHLCPCPNPREGGSRRRREGQHTPARRVRSGRHQGWRVMRGLPRFPSAGSYADPPAVALNCAR